MHGPRLFVVAGTLVPKTEWKRLPFFVRWSLQLLQRLHLLPRSAERLIADTLYLSVKRLGHCWVVPLEALGLVAPHVTYQAIKKVFLEAALANGGQRMVVKGQSQGGRYAVELALDPDTRDYVAAVQADGWPSNGTMAIKTLWLFWTQLFPGVREMLPGSGTLKALHCRMRTRWLKRIPFCVVVSPDDILVTPWRSALKIKLRKGCEVRRYVVSPVKPTDVEEDFIWIRTDHKIGHLKMEWEDVVLDLTAELLAEFAPPVTPVIPMPTRRSSKPRAIAA